MTPREALYTIVVKLGPVPQTKRDDNITHEEARIRDAVEILKELVEKSEKLDHFG